MFNSVSLTILDKISNPVQDQNIFFLFLHFFFADIQTIRLINKKN